MHSPHQRSPFNSSPITTTTTTLPPSTNDSFYYDNTTSFFHPSPVQAYPPSKRAKIEQTYNFNSTDIPSTFDCPPLVYPTAMPQAIHRQRPFAPHISLQRASEPASPVTIASTLSTHSTPSPSPSRVTIVGDNAPADFSLYEDGFPAPEHQLKLQAPRHRFTANTSNPSHTSFNGSLPDMDPSWPVCAPQVIDFSNVHRQQQQQQRQQQQQQYFHQNMPTFNNNGTFSHHSDDEELPALSPSRGTTSRPSISEGGDMPVTPQHSPIHHDGNHCAQQAPTVQHNHSVPKLNRTISDAVQDELFNPGIAPGTTHAQSERPSETNSHLPTLFQHAQNQHAMAARSTPTNQPMMIIRDHSPFRANSPFHPARTHQGIITSPTRTTAFLNPGPYASARARREKDIEREAEALREQMKKEYDEMQQTPKTISPKDAYIEYNEPEGNAVQGGLFNGGQNDDSYSQHSTADIKSESDAESYRGSAHSDNEGQHPGSSRRASDVTMDYMYPGNAQQFGDHLNVPGYGWGGDESSSQGSTEPTGRNYELTSSVLRRPEDTMANDGAYSCTVHGCTERFSTASKMSKHRREAHRNNAPLGRDAPIKSLLQGPSRCARINPTTGKPCNTVFSRPYDLTRHEDTIHNTARQKVRCEICNDEKTFSRQDALTRHKKVKHGIDK